MKKVLLLLSLVLSTASCVSQAEQITRFSDSCVEVGFKRQTEDHFNCMVKMEEMRRAKWKALGDGFKNSNRQKHEVIIY